MVELKVGQQVKLRQHSILQTTTRQQKIVQVVLEGVVVVEQQVQVYRRQSQVSWQLALVADRKMAFILARQNDCAPVNVH